MAEERTEKIKKDITIFLKDKYNLILIAVLLFSLILFLYYFNLTKNQPLWWDESEYMSIAKNWAFHTFEYKNPQRPILLPFLAFLLYTLGFSDVAIKFLVVLLPAWLAVLFMYLFVKSMYDKRTAILAAFITSVSWIHIFYAVRFMTDSIGFLAGLLAFYCFWQGYVNNKGRKYIWLIGFFIALSFLSRLTGVLYGVVIVLFLLITSRFKFLKNKDLWISLLIFFLTISPYLIWSYFQFNNALAFRAGYSSEITKGYGLGWNLVQFVYDYPGMVFFILFLIGIITLIPMFLSFDILVLKNDKKFYNDLFMFLSIISLLAFFIYFIRIAENRWLMLMSIGIFTLSAKGMVLAYDFVRKNLGKVLAISLVVVILIFGAYVQISQIDQIIKGKVGSYQQIKDAALWMKQNSNPGDSVLSVSYTQTIFYYESPVYTYSEMNETQFNELIEKTHPRYLMISIFEPHHPPWLIQQGQQDNYQIIALPYFNSSIVFQNDKILGVDIKQQTKKDSLTFNYVYPTQQITGVFVYEIVYPKSTSISEMYTKSK